MADSKKYDGSQWEHSLRELGTATETIQSGDTIYANGQPITAYTLKGNEEHTGTPSPQNPVMPNGVGERSANLVSMSEPQGDGYLANSVVGITGDGRENIISAQAFFVTEYIPVSEGTYYYYSDLYRATANNAKFMFYNANKEFIGYANRQPALEEQPVYELSSFSAPANAAYMRMNIDKSSTKNCLYTSQLPSYEPYGAYKIPILNGQQSIDIYIGDLPLLKSLDGTAVDEISNGTLTRRVDSDGSVLPAPITTQITMPSIPTTDGANSITVDTTVQPSEFTATWTGWHDSSVKEYDGSDWQ